MNTEPHLHFIQCVRAYTELQQFKIILIQDHQLFPRFNKIRRKSCKKCTGPYRHKWKIFKIFNFGYCVHSANNVVLAPVTFSSNSLATYSIHQIRNQRQRLIRVENFTNADLPYCRNKFASFPRKSFFCFRLTSKLKSPGKSPVTTSTPVEEGWLPGKRTKFVRAKAKSYGSCGSGFTTLARNTADCASLPSLTYYFKCWCRGACFFFFFCWIL